MAELIRHKDWSKTALGPISDWPASLRIAVSMVLDSPLPTIVLWGSELIQIYNDAYQPILGARHPAAMGMRTQDCWPEVWHFNAPLYRRVLEHGECIYFKDQEYLIAPSGVPETRYFTITYAPARHEQGSICGVSILALETTERVLVERTNDALLDTARLAAARHAFQLRLSDSLRSLSEPDDIIATANELLGRHLNVSRVMYAEVDEFRGTFSIRRDWRQPGIFSMAGEARQLDDFGPEIISCLRAGDAMVVDDVALDPRTADFAEAYAKVCVRANLALPLVKHGKLIAILSLHENEPRHWTEHDMGLAQAVAERTWASVENAKAQAELRAERDHSRYIFDSMTEGIAIIDHDWTVLQMNAEGLRIGGRMESEVIGRCHWDVWPEVKNSELESFYRQLVTSRIAGTLEFNFLPPEAPPAWLEIRAYPTSDGRLVVFFRDINERKQIEQKLQEADRRKDEFLAMLAHELRNPLAPVSAAAQLLKLVKLDDVQLRKTSEIIERQVSHMTGLVDDLLDLSRVRRGLVELEKTPLPIRRIVADAV